MTFAKVENGPFIIAIVSHRVATWAMRNQQQRMAEMVAHLRKYMGLE